MSRLVLLLMAVGFIVPFAWANTDEQDPTFVIPFDDFDESTLQTEVERQALTFLNNLRQHWGRNPRALRAAVSGTVRDDQQGKLIYLRNIGDHGVLEGYEFRQESLVRGQYILLQRPLNGLNEFIGYYQSLKQVLAHQFGAPLYDRVVWDNDLYQPVPDYWGVAVMMGQLHYHAAWETTEGIVTLELTGNHHSKLLLEFKSNRAGEET